MTHQSNAADIRRSAQPEQGLTQARWRQSKSTHACVDLDMDIQPMPEPRMDHRFHLILSVDHRLQAPAGNLRQFTGIEKTFQ
jgi:hypothetical protein